MTGDEYLKRSAAIQERLTIARGQIDAHVENRSSKTDSSIVRPLLDRQQEIIDELIAFD